MFYLRRGNSIFMGDRIYPGSYLPLPQGHFLLVLKVENLMLLPRECLVIRRLLLDYELRQTFIKRHSFLQFFLRTDQG